MTTYFIEDALNDGFVDRWLLAGPRALEVPDLERFTGADFKLQILRHYDTRAPGVDAPEELKRFTPEDASGELRWKMYRCEEDHFVNLSAFYHTCHHLRSWAAARVVCPAEQTITLALTVNAPADVWVDGVHVHRTEVIQHQIPHTSRCTLTLGAGEREILVRFEAVATRECPYVMALRLEGAGDWPVRLPTPVDAGELRAGLERTFAVAYLEHEVYSGEDQITVRWPADLAEPRRQICLRLQDTQQHIFVEAHPYVEAGFVQSFGTGAQFRDGAYQVVLMPHPEVYYEQNVRVMRVLPLHILKNPYSDAPYGSDAERRIEALVDAADRSGIYAEIANMELGRWSALKPKVILAEIDGINRRKDCSDFYLVGLLGAWLRYGSDPAFPPDLRAAIEDCALAFRYWSDDPGADAMWFWSENHQILFHACEVLAGQCFPDRVFSNTGQTGAWHRARGTAFALAWLRKRAASGFREWDSNTYFEHDVLALSHLADLAEDEQLREMAAVVMDKLLFTMALNSHRGAFGSTHGRAYSSGILGARLELTSPISRLLWGMGVFNNAILGSVALACARSYALPYVIADVATAQISELWARERHRQELTFAYDREDGVLEVNKVTYRTADTMLCSAQDYRAGQPGVQQHVWQATFDHDAVVFVSHPPCVSLEGSHRPNFWHGNVTLPRVAQWYDTLFDLRHIPDSDWMGFTHAYFPVFAFDQYEIEGGWAFARRGNGYLAVTAACGVELVTRGVGAYRELRSYGRRNVWVCQLGNAARDGDFRFFQSQVLAADLQIKDLTVRYTSLHGEALEFGWDTPLLVDGTVQPLEGFRHYDSPICTCDMDAPTMEIVGWNDILRLEFGG